MADELDDFDFDDDALDDLPANALNELEHNAFLSTQHARSPVAKAQARVDEKGQWARHNNSSVAGAAVQATDRAPSDYGVDDEDIINLEEQPLEVQQAYDQWSQRQRIVDRLTSAPGREDSHMQDASGRPGVDILDLQERVLKLEAERMNLQRTVEEARSAAQSRAGEAAVLRQKYEKSAKEYEQKITTLRQLHQEAYNKQKAELDAVKREHKRIADDNKFLEHDLVREAGRVRQVQRSLKDVTNSKGKEGSDALVGTPKKSRVLPFRDGFDDSDMIISPSKSRERSRPGTPKASAKRKRPGTTPQESPIQMEPLLLSQPRPQPSPMKVDGLGNDGLQSKTKGVGDVIKLPPRPTVLQMLLNHKVAKSEERVMEVLTNFAFPSKLDKKFSSIVYDSIGSVGGQTSRMSEVLCDCLISLWGQCIEETFYEPVDILTDTVRLILSHEHLAFTRKYIAPLVPLCISTIDLVAIPLARASLAQNQPQPNQAKAELQNTPEAHQISVFDTLTLLHTIGLSCVGYPNDMQTFWLHMKFDFVLLVLMRAQPLPQISLTLSLLRLSVLRDTFGAILTSEDGGVERQSRRESDTIDRLTLLLAEKFPLPEGEDALSHHIAVLELRLQVLSVFEAMLLSPHSSLLLAAHKYMLGRLIRFLDSAITSLYTHHPSTHALKTTSINTAMRIVYTLLSTPDTREVIDIRAKLSVVPQGSSKWLIALTRLAFADPVVFEEGISVESMDAAHGLLDEWLSPVEGEGLLMMFGSERSET